MAIVICTSCGNKGNAPATYRGKTVQCPKCGNRFVIPGEDKITPAAIDDEDDKETYALGHSEDGEAAARESARLLTESLRPKSRTKTADIVTSPAQWLLITGIATVLIHAVGVGYWLFPMLGHGGTSEGFPVMRVLAVAFSFCGLMAGIFICNGAVTMRFVEGYRLVQGAAIVALTPLTFFLGLPAGVWCLTALAREGVKKDFIKGSRRAKTRQIEGLRRDNYSWIPMTLFQGGLGILFICVGLVVAYKAGHKAVTDVPQQHDTRTAEWHRDLAETGNVAAAARFGAEVGHWEGGVTSVAFCPDGKQFLTGSADGAIRLWDARDGREIRQFSGHSGAISGLAVSTDSRRLASGSLDNMVRVWERESGAEVRLYQGHGSPVQGVAISADGKRVVSASQEGFVRLWEVDTGKDLQDYNFNELVKNVAFSPDDRFVAMGGNNKNLTFWFPGNRKEAHLVSKTTVTAFTIVPESPLVLFTTEEGQARVLNWEVRAMQGREMRHPSGAIVAAGLLPGRRAVTAGADETIRLWNFDTGKELGSMSTKPAGAVRSLAPSPNGSQILFCCSNGGMYLWQVGE